MSHRRAWLAGLTSSLVILASPTASAQIDSILSPEGAPFVAVALTPSMPLNLTERKHNEAINLTIEAKPQLAVPASAFAVSAFSRDPFAQAAALDCMTAAVYYEAANESISGQRAVAQVILNRVRHPAFPDSVCGVVFQGSERATGCQFTFTCDGSLYRKPSPALWSQARTVAAGALGGFVEASVGHATHYHAKYVVPYWAPSLTKLTTIGMHIFYQWKGGWSKPSAFSDRYAAAELMPAKLRTALNAYLISAPNPVDDPALPALSAAVETQQPPAKVNSESRIALTASEVRTDLKSEALPTNLKVLKSELIETKARLKDTAIANSPAGTFPSEH